MKSGLFHRQHNFIFNLIFIIIFWNNCFFPEILKKKNVLLVCNLQQQDLLLYFL